MLKRSRLTGFSHKQELEITQILIYKDPTQPVETRVDDLLSRMTLEEKIGQMAQTDIRGIKPKDVTKHFMGSIFSGSGAAPTSKVWATGLI